MRSFSNRLKELREGTGLTQKQMAEELNISPRAYQIYEYDEGLPTVQKLIALADFFDVSLDYLVGRSDIRERS